MPVVDAQLGKYVLQVEPDGSLRDSEGGAYLLVAHASFDLTGAFGTK